MGCLINETDNKLTKTLELNSSASQKKKRLFGKPPPPDFELAERFSPDYTVGLNSEQVADRTLKGYVNTTRKPTGKTYRSIIFGNIFTIINLIVLIVVVALAVSGATELDDVPQYFFSFVIVINVIIGIVQEVRAKRAVAKLSLIGASQATVIRNGERKTISVDDVVLDDILYYESGQQVNSDAVVLSGEPEINESLLTGESVPINKKPGDTLYSGSFVTSGSCYARADKVGDESYINKLVGNVRRYKKPKSELQETITRLIRILLAVMAPIVALLLYSYLRNGGQWRSAIEGTSGAIVGMIPAGMYLLTSIALAISMLRLAKKRTLVKDLYGIEMLARVDVLCLDKTGTITDGSMTVEKIVELSALPNGMSFSEIIGNMLTVTGDNNQTALALANEFGYAYGLTALKTLPFSSLRKFSAVSFEQIGTFIIGAPEFVVKDLGARHNKMMQEYMQKGFRVVVLAHSPSEIKDDKLPAVKKPLAFIVIKDTIRDDAFSTIEWFKENKVSVRVISGDNPVTVAEVARRVGIEGADNFVSLEGFSNQQVIEAAPKYTVFGRVSPEQKCLLITALKGKGHTVAMTGDGVNDLLALREADCSIAIASGSEAARKVSHLVLSDNNFSSMTEVVKEGRQAVNNIQSVASLILMSAFMAIGLALITIFRSLIEGGVRYPLLPNNQILFGIFVTAIPPFFLALQPATKPITGRFTYNIVAQSIPSALVLVINITAVALFAEFYHGYEFVYTPEFGSLMAFTLTFTALVMLVRLCEPLNLFRILLVVGCFLGCVVAIIVEAASPLVMIGIVGMQAINVLFVLTMVLISYFLVGLLIKAMDKIKKLTAKTSNREQIRN